uniref:methyl-accepting chemotaxis protein n=1 Tax=Thaumasiovibrio occultus TaxID=1891184 RepID=UPI000B34F441|nr:methyl-accepting chemotaxis protein [Thaumasiovibrio occultus]
MKNRRQPSIIARMNIGFFFLVVLFVATTTLMQSSTKLVYGQLEKVTSEAYPLYSLANQTSVSLLAADKVFKDFLTTQDPSQMEAYQAEFAQAQSKFNASLTALNDKAGNLPALREQLEQLTQMEERYFEEAKVAMTNYQEKLVAEAERSAAVRRYQVLYGELSNGMQSYINESDNIAVKMISRSYFVKLGQTEKTTSDALANEDPNIVGKALKDNKRSVTQLAYAFGAIVRQDAKIGEVFQTSIDQFVLDIGKPGGILDQHYNYLVAKEKLYSNIATLAQEVDSIMQLLGTFVNVAEGMMDQSIAVADSAHSNATTKAALFSILGLGICVLIGWYISTRIRSPLHSLISTLERMTQGDMTQRSPRSKFREFEQLNGHVNNLASTLQEIIRELSQTSSGLTAVASDNQTITNEVKSRLQGQGDRTASAATAMTQMDHSVKDVSISAESTMEKVHAVESAAGAGRDIMSRSISTTQQLSSRIDESVRAVNELEKMSQDIGAILDVIRNIADQTNLLALNAAIEAARAGEQGRGFAVVADEVRVLASKTTSSTQEIENMIHALQQGSGQVATLMKSCVSEMANNSNQTSDANSAMEEVLSLILQISEMSSQISQAAAEQTNTSSNIAATLEDISHIADTNFHSMEDVAKVSDQLEQLAHKQSEIVKRFVV